MGHQIDVIGLGAGDLDQIPLGIYRRLKQEHTTIYIRTVDHPVVRELKREGVAFHAFDTVYETHDSFEQVYEAIVTELLRASEDSAVIYAVPGHPMMAEKTVQLLRANPDVTVNVIGGQSFLDDLFTVLGIDPIDGLQFLDGTDLHRADLKLDQPMIVAQVYDRMIASYVKLTLLEDLPPDYDVTIVEAAGTKQEKVTIKQLSKLDHTDDFNNLTSVYVPPLSKDLLNHTFPRLRDVIARLRGPSGCPWDRAQTHESLRAFAIEEVYELIEAIDLGDDEAIEEELGDILLQVMLHSQIGEDDGFFSVDDVIQALTEKMVHRHPHVFGDVQVETVEDVRHNWNLLKQQEKGDSRPSMMDGIPKNLPALVRALKLQKKVAKVGFDWGHASLVWNKFDEERREVEASIAENELGDLEKEFGDMLFTMVNLARHYNIRPEIALNRTNETFNRRFRHIELRMSEQRKHFHDVTLEELDHYWDEAKTNEKE